MNPDEWFSAAAITAILAMTAMTYLMRVGGFWLMGHVPITPRVRRMLDALPGAVVVAIVLPLVVKSGASAYAGIAAVTALMIATGNQFLAIGAGVGAVIAARYFGF
jgi:uncharacterized membrane protein